MQRPFDLSLSGLALLAFSPLLLPIALVPKNTEATQHKGLYPGFAAMLCLFKNNVPCNRCMSPRIACLGAACFLINILGYIFKDYSSVVLLLTGVLKAMDTLILAFYPDPVLARISRRERAQADLALRSVFLAQIDNFCVALPLVLLCAFAVTAFMTHDSSTPVLARFSGDKAVYIRVHIIMAVVGAVLISGALYLAGNPDWWVGVVGSFTGIAMRGYYIASEQLGFEWVLGPHGLQAPNERVIGLGEIATVRSLFGSVQVITNEGEKFLIKYQAEPERVIAEINRAVAAHA